MFMRRVRMMGGGAGARAPPTNEGIAQAYGIGVKTEPPELAANISNLTPGLVDKFPVIQEVFRKNGVKPFITSGNDPDPNRVQNSDHENDIAIDLRANYPDLTDEKQDKIAADLQKELGDNYYVESEHPINKKTGEREEGRDHIHISYRPK